MGESAPISTLIGQTVGNYEVVSKLGEGGMGSVYLARHPRIGKQVALKVLHTEFASDTSIVDRFFTEAKSVNDIQHPNIVDIIDYGELPGPDGKPMVYFIMEFLDGQSVADLVGGQAPVDPERAFRIAAQIADALAASHRHKVVHRDLKPDNIFLIKRGRQPDFVKVLDFGIAKLTGDQPGSRRTRTGIVIGTPYYMSPEQCEGKGNVDRRTDIYALGVVLFELLTGRVPFEGEGYGEILVQHLTQLPPRPGAIQPGMSPYVEVVCLKALEKQRENRYENMEQFQTALLDPVAFVEQRGGVQAFLSGGANVRLASQPAPHPAYTSAGRGQHGTPVPPGTPPPVGGGHAAAVPTPPPFAGGGAGRSDATPFPQPLHSLTHTPTPPPGYADDFDPRPLKSKTPMLVVGGLLVAAVAVALVFALGGDGESASSGEVAVGTPSSATDAAAAAAAAGDGTARC